MSNLNKILITVACCVLMICVATVSIVKIVTDSKTENNTTTSGVSDVSDVSGETTSELSTDTIWQNTDTYSTSDTSATSDYGTTLTTSAASSTETGVLATDIIGKWKDSAGMSGYEFYADGKVNSTAVDLAAFGIPFDLVGPGIYTLEGNNLTIKYSIYTATIEFKYTVSIENGVLSMYNIEERQTSTYMRSVN